MGTSLASFSEKNVKIKEHSKQAMAYRTRKHNSSVFVNIERTDDAGLRFITEDFKVGFKFAECSFENNTVYFYGSGTGMFSTQITVTFQEEQNIDLVRETELFARGLIKDKLQNEILTYSRVFSRLLPIMD
jgi:hypothetical protein